MLWSFFWFFKNYLNKNPRILSLLWLSICNRTLSPTFKNDESSPASNFKIPRILWSHLLPVSSEEAQQWRNVRALALKALSCSRVIGKVMRFFSSSSQIITEVGSFWFWIQWRKQDALSSTTRTAIWFRRLSYQKFII